MPNRITVRVAIFLLLLVVLMQERAGLSQSSIPATKVNTAIIVTRTRDTAAGVLEQLKAGMDFGVLAKERSIDLSANDGGYLRPESVAKLPIDLQDAVHGLKPGQFTQPLRHPEGFAILALLRNAPRTEDLNQKQIQSIAIAAHIRQSINVAGMSEEDAVFAEYQKPSDWQQNLERPCEVRKLSHADAVRRMQNLLNSGQTPAGGKASPLEQLRSHIVLAQLQAFVGKLDESIKEWKSAYDIARSSVPGAIPYLQEALGTSYLHLAEMENGAYRESGSIDIFPPLAGAVSFRKPENARLALNYFSAFLDAAPDDLQVRWLLNLTYVMLGQYPQGVPPKYLIAQNAFRSYQDIGHFTDVGREAGLNVFSAAGGVIADDFDNDGLLDVMTSSADMCDSLHFFHNNGDGTFTDRTTQAGLTKQLGGLNLIQADYNNDGCMDVLVLRAGWEFPVRNSLLRNNCNGTFTDVTRQSGLSNPLGPTQTAAWADVDNDGYLDLFVGNENASSQLFHNRGDGTFEDISHAAHVDQTAFTKGVVAADYDKDGFVDFYLSNFDGANVLYHNNHDLTFTDVARQAGVQAPLVSFATWFFDYDNDGWPDLFVTSYNSYTDDQILRSYIGMPVSVETMKLYRNQHDGTFEDVTAKVGLDRVFMPMGANFGDVDNDGYLDVYLGMGSPSFATMLPHVLLRNDAGKSFVDITASSGTGEIHKGHGIAFADLDHSGHESILAETGGAVPSDKHTMRVFKSPMNRNDWINVKLTGVKSNRAAIGAEIKVTVVDGTGPPRSIFRTIGESSSFGSNPMEQHIGLGQNAHIVSLEVWWPATQTRQTFADLSSNQFIAVEELAKTYTTLDRKPFQVGGATGSPVQTTISVAHP